MKKQNRKERISLTLLFAAVIFVVLLLSVGLTVLTTYILTRFGVLIDSVDGKSTFLFMGLISIVLGAVFALLTSRFSLKPVNNIISQINRLASGDFKARLSVWKPLKNHPTFAEITDSFNTMAQELENTQMLRSDFINNFSHEFKTPIVSIAGFAKLIRKGNLTDEQKEEYLAIIEEESLRLSAMATNVLALTNIENHTILTDVTTYNLSEQLRSCVLLLEDHWSRKNLSLELEFDEYEISANEELLKQVWINLLDNAIKFSPPTGEILLQVMEKEDVLRVRVTNFGSEIPEDKLGKIWGRFYQADESHASQGNGIGLAIVKYIVELHKGEVSVKSKNGMTTFTVELPKK